MKHIRKILQFSEQARSYDKPRRKFANVTGTIKKSVSIYVIKLMQMAIKGKTQSITSVISCKFQCPAIDQNVIRAVLHVTLFLAALLVLTSPVLVPARAPNTGVDLKISKKFVSTFFVNRCTVK